MGLRSGEDPLADELVQGFASGVTGLLPFLDDMHRLGLLRTVGPVYQFRHAELQDHLAPAPSPDGDPQQAAGTEPSRRISF
ncbi:hypothetical protein [Nonomuraea insulae]|uniref:Uncharacterized protein n=1 Tax=Nonomuraea insulae TaxID=1616787 RepID=A0ABW1CNR5_9ACTN